MLLFIARFVLKYNQTCQCYNITLELVLLVVLVDNIQYNHQNRSFLFILVRLLWLDGFQNPFESCL